MGLAVCRSLASADCRVIAIVRSEPSVELQRLENVEVVKSNISDFEPRKHLMQIRDATLIDCAWERGFEHNWLGHLTQVQLHLSFVENLILSGIKRVVSIGSRHELGNVEGEVSESACLAPTNLYGSAKTALFWLLQSLCKTSEIEFLWLRGFYFFGDDDRNSSLWSKIIESDRNREAKFLLDSCESTFDFLEIGRAAN